MSLSLSESLGYIDRGIERHREPGPNVALECIMQEASG